MTAQVHRRCRPDISFLLLEVRGMRRLEFSNLIAYPFIQVLPSYVKVLPSTTKLVP